MEIGVSSCLQACRIRGLQCLSGPGIGWACIGFVSRRSQEDHHTDRLTEMCRSSSSCRSLSLGHTTEYEKLPSAFALHGSGRSHPPSCRQYTTSGTSHQKMSNFITIHRITLQATPNNHIAGHNSATYSVSQKFNSIYIIGL